MEGYYYHEGFCPSDHLRGFYPVRYNAVGVGSPFVKESMACTRLEKGNCDKYSECEMFQNAPEIIEESKQYLVRSKK